MSPNALSVGTNVAHGRDTLAAVFRVLERIDGLAHSKPPRGDPVGGTRLASDLMAAETGLRFGHFSNIVP